MGLKKEITLSNGVSVSYHRIVSINNITNVCNIIDKLNDIYYNLYE